MPVGLRQCQRSLCYQFLQMCSIVFQLPLLVLNIGQQLSFFQTSFDCDIQFRKIYGFLQIIKGPRTHHSDCGFDIAIPSHDNTLQHRGNFHSMSYQFTAIHAGHLEVGNKHINLFTPQDIQGLQTRMRRMDFIGKSFQSSGH